jgi:HNH endonuclease
MTDPVIERAQRWLEQERSGRACVGIDRAFTALTEPLEDDPGADNLTAYSELLHRLDELFYIPPVYCVGGWDDPHAMERRLAELKAMSYDDYLLTPEWRETREVALARADHRCQGCNSPSSLQVHHRTYERRGEEGIRDLTVLCGTCHGRVHGVLD